MKRLLAKIVLKVLKTLHIVKYISDEIYLKIIYMVMTGRQLNLANPQTFNEKLQWLKLYDRKPIYTTMVDKYKAKKYVASIIGEEYIIPTLGVWDKFDDIDFDKLPNQFVLKCTHDSGGLIICKDKSKLNIDEAKKKIQASLKVNYYWTGREWPYKNVKPRIIAEQFIEDSSGSIVDYKFFCFNGYVDSVMLCIDRNSGDTKFYFFNKNWKLCRYNIRGKSAPEDFTLPRPENIERMFEISEQLSQGIPFARIDLYNSDGQIYFGEITFFPDSGFDTKILPENDLLLGKLIKQEDTKL